MPASTSPTSLQSTGSTCSPSITIARFTLVVGLFVHSGIGFVAGKLISGLGSFVSTVLQVDLSSPFLQALPSSLVPAGLASPGLREEDRTREGQDLQAILLQPEKEARVLLHPAIMDYYPPDSILATFHRSPRHLI